MPKIKIGQTLLILKYLFFFLFIFSIPLQKRHIFFDTPLAGTFNEWTAISLYLSDILLGATLLFWLAEFLAKNNPRLFPVTRYSLPVPDPTRSLFPITYYLLPITILIWLSFSIIHATNLNLAAFRLAKLLELILLFFFVVHNLKIQKYRHYTYAIFLFTMIVQSLIALVQYWQQKSLGLKFFGENDLSPQMIGVAKIVVAGEKTMRPYGTFPHPNVLAGFLITAIIFCFYFWSMKRISSRIYYKIILFCLISIFTIALIFTFSRSSWLGLIIALIIFVAISYKKIKILLPALTVFALTAVIVSIIFWPQIASRGTISDSPNGDFALSNRIFLNQIAFTFISKNPWFGVGIGNFPSRLSRFTLELPAWRLQPVHNIYLAYAAEIGIPGLLLFLLFLWSTVSLGLKQIFKNKEIAFLLSLLFAYLVIGLLDHYFYDLQQGMLIFWLMLALIWTILILPPKPRLTK